MCSVLMVLGDLFGSLAEQALSRRPLSGQMMRSEGGKLRVPKSGRLKPSYTSISRERSLLGGVRDYAPLDLPTCRDGARLFK